VIATLMGDSARADAQVAAVRGRRDDIEMIFLQTQAAAYRGRMREAERLTEDIVRRAEAINRIGTAGEALLAAAISQAAVGRVDVARAELDRVTRTKLLTDAALDEVIILSAAMGDGRLARMHIEKAVAHTRTATRAEDVERNITGLRAYAALATGHHEEAYRLALAIADDTSEARRHTNLVAGLAALRLGRWDDAAKALTALTELRAKLGLSTIHGVGFVMLGRAHAAAGRSADARAAYERAFTIWKDADPDMPLLVEARKEHAALR
jgi:tetratricopeptide (TPR) repeat protein